MATIKDLRKLIDVTAIEKTNVVDPLKARKDMVQKVAKAITTFKENPKAKGKKLFRLKNAGVVITLPFETGAEIDLKDGTRGIPTSMDKAEETLKLVQELLEQGDFDGQLASNVVRERSGWSPERRAKQEATIAARKAKK